MNEPIIEPMFFYWMQMLDTIEHTVIPLIVITLFLTTIGIFASAMTYCVDKNKIAKVALIIFSVSSIVLSPVFLISLAIPTSDTYIKMKIAENVTYERLNKVTDKAGEIKDIIKTDIIDIINELKKEKQND